MHIDKQNCEVIVASVNAAAKHCILTLALTSLIGGCAPKPRSSDSELGGRFDAGGVIYGKTGTLSHVFKLHNNTSGVMFVKKIEKSCGCASATISNNLIRPAETAEVVLSVVVSPTYADKIISCTIHMDKPEMKPYRFDMSFKSYSRLEGRPVAVDFGKIVRSSTNASNYYQLFSINTFHKDNEPSDAIESLRVPEGFIVEPAGKPFSDSPSRGVIRVNHPFRIALRLEELKTKTAGRNILSLKVKTNQGESLSLPVTWTWQDSIGVAPGRLHSNYETNMEPITSTLLLRSFEGKRFRVLSVRGDKGCSIELGEPTRIGPRSAAEVCHGLTLKIRPIGVTGSRVASGTVTIETDDDHCPKVRVEWSAFLGPSE